MAKFLVPISNFEFWPVKNRSKSFKICHWVLLCLSCSCTVLDTVCSPAIPATVLVGAASTRRQSHLSAVLLLSRTPRSFPGRPNPPFSSSVHDEPSSSEQHRAKPPPLVAPANPRRRMHFITFALLKIRFALNLTYLLPVVPWL